MGKIRFTIRHPQLLAEAAHQRAYIATGEGFPYRGKVELQDGTLELWREENDSGFLTVPILLPSVGERMLATGSLMEQPEQPYDLCLELLRGVIHRLQQQFLHWKDAGLEVVPEFAARLEELRRRFAHFAACPTEVSDTDTIALLSESVAAGDALANHYVKQVLHLRHERHEKLPVLCGVKLQQPPQLDASQLQTFSNAAAVSLNWRAIESNEGEFDWRIPRATLEACRAQKLKTVCGPLLDLRSFNVPDWIYLWEDSFADLTDTVLHFAGEATRHLSPLVQIWNVAAGINTDLAIGMSEAQRLKLTLQIVERVKRVDSKKPLIVTLAQPWSEYLRDHDWELPALHFADDLLRSGVGVTGIGLEIDLGYHAPGETPRDLLTVSRMLDQWSLLQVPLVIWLSTPANSNTPTKQQRGGLPLPNNLANTDKSVTAHGQAELAKSWIPLLLAKQCVHAVFWSQLTDASLGGAAGGGLFEPSGKPREVLRVLQDLRQHLAP